MSVLKVLHSTSNCPAALLVVSGMMHSESLKPSADSSAVAPRVSARMNASDFATVSKFFGTAGDGNHVVEYEAFVVLRTRELR